jgi:hypothetical protein
VEQENDSYKVVEEALEAEESASDEELDDGEIYDSLSEPEDEAETESSTEAEEDVSDPPAAPEKEEKTIDLHITANGEDVVLKNKTSYILVDVLDFYPFDLSVAKGNKLETLVNGISSEFTKPLGEGDEVRIYWI